jgi:hypothetical protein
MADPLVDRGCAIFDGACDCPRPVHDNCKKYVQFVHDEFHEKPFDVLDEDHPPTCRCEVCRFWS